MQLPDHSAGSVPQLPFELWYKIVDYLQDEEVNQLSNVNHFFHGVTIDLQLRRVDLFNSNPYLFFRWIEAIQSPQLAARANTLRVMPYATWQAIRFSPESIYRNPVSVAQKLSKSIQDSLRSPQQRSPSTPLSNLAAPCALIFLSKAEKERAIVSTVKGLISVENLAIRWGPEWNNRRDAAIDPICPLLATFLPAHSNNLTSLHLDIYHRAPLSVLFSTNFTSLQELSIKFYVNGYYDGMQETGIVYRIASFINKVSNTLQSLSAGIFGSGYSYLLFDTLNTLPHIVSLTLALPIDPHDLPLSRNLNQFLHRHDNVQHLNLHFAPCPFVILHRNADISDWYQGHFGNVSFRSLRTLELGLGGPFAVTPGHMESFRLLSQQVRSLKIIGIRLSYSQTETILAALDTKSLEILSIFIEDVTTELIDLLARECSNVRRLTLETECVNFTLREDAGTDLEQFRAIMREHREHVAVLYDSWKLNDLEVWQRNHEGNLRLQFDIMRAIAESIPTVKRFAGQNFMLAGDPERV